jgi:hypothetical protein
MKQDLKRNEAAYILMIGILLGILMFFASCSKEEQFNAVYGTDFSIRLNDNFGGYQGNTFGVICKPEHYLYKIGNHKKLHITICDMSNYCEVLEIEKIKGSQYAILNEPDFNFRRKLGEKYLISW